MGEGDAMLGNVKISKLIFDRSAFSARELGRKYGKSCYQISYPPIQAHCHAYKFLCSIKINHRFLHEKYALMSVLLFFIVNVAQLGTHSFYPILRNLMKQHRIHFFIRSFDENLIIC